MRIGIDIDDTMADTFDFMMPYVAEFFNMDLKYLKENNISYNTLTDEMKKRENEFAKTYFDIVVPDTPFKPDAKEYVDKIKQLGNEIIIITARDKTLYEDEYKATIKELKNNNIYYDKLICNRDKATVFEMEKIDLVIDDSVKHCISANQLGIETILFNSKKNINQESELYRVNNWHEVYEKVKSLMNK